MNMALELNDSIFEEKVLKSDKPVLVDFWLNGGPCRIVGPIIDELSKEFEGRLLLKKLMLIQIKNLLNMVSEIFLLFYYLKMEVNSRQVGVAQKNI